MGPHRSRNCVCIVFDEADDLRHGPIPIRIVALIAEARQPALPVRRQQTERIPALGTPRMSHLAALQDHVIDRALGEATAHGEAGVPGPDDDGGDGTNGSHSYRAPAYNAREVSHRPVNRPALTSTKAHVAGTSFIRYRPRMRLVSTAPSP